MLALALLTLSAAEDALQLLELRSPVDGLFLDAYPRHYVAQRLEGELVIDGELKESAWEVPWTQGAFRDIAQPLFPGYVLPEGYSTKVKVRWDEKYLYVAAFVGEPWVESGFVWGSNAFLTSTNPISNSNVPYYDNDFEVFIDVSGTNHWYKEFEMNFNNATYDVLWRVPDGGLNSTGVPCCSINECHRFCQNSSWPPFGGTWSMYPNLKTATRRASKGWTVEIAFPLHPKDGIGGLLSAGHGTSMERFDPNAGAKYWSVDFSRAEHPFFTSNSSLFAQLCPSIQQSQPTLLGSDQWSCYWEWVWQSLGGINYMHNPDHFGFLQFADPGEERVCRNIEWPARYVLSQVYQAEVAYAKSTGHYTDDLGKLLQGDFCNIYNACNVTRLEQVNTIYASLYNLKISVDNAARSCVKYATVNTSSNYSGGPCFKAHVHLRTPKWQVDASIREDRFLDVSSSGSGCLPGPHHESYAL